MNFGSVISKHRTAIMGFAAILIVCFHVHMKTGFFLWDLIVDNHGNLGVDFFVFVAGFGLAFSLAKNDGFYRFYSRKLRRVLPPYYAAILLMLAIMAVYALFTGEWIAEDRWALKNLIPLGVWAGNGVAFWYVPATLAYYAIAPLFYFLIRDARYPRVMTVFLLILTGLLLPATYQYEVADIAVLRVPALVAGLAMGIFQKTHNSRRDRWIDLAMLAVMFLLGILISQMDRTAPSLLLRESQIYRLYNNLTAPFLVVMLALVIEGLSRTPLRFLNWILERAGRYSLEIYMSHLILRGILKNLLGLERYALLAALLAFSYPLAVLLDRGGAALLRLVKRLPILKDNGASIRSPEN